jgi:hypothetical protein
MVGTFNTTSQTIRHELAVGGAGSEQIIIPFMDGRNAASGQIQPNLYMADAVIPAGSRIAAHSLADNASVVSYMSLLAMN